MLTLKNDIVAIEQLIKCCRSSGAPNAHVISDHVLTHCMKLLSNRLHSEQNLALKNHIDILIKLIIDTKLRVRFTYNYINIYLLKENFNVLFIYLTMLFLFLDKCIH